MDKVSIRASGFAELFDCPARWEAKHIKKIYSPSTGASQRGTAIHLGTAVFDEGRIAGNTVSVDEAVEIMHDAIYDPDLDVDWSDITRDEAFQTSISPVAKYCLDISPQFEFEAVELRCESVEIQTDDITLRLTGAIDRIYKKPEGMGVADIKTGNRIINADGEIDAKPHKIQLSVYRLLASLQLSDPMDLPSLVFGIKPDAIEASAGIAESNASIEYLTGKTGQPGMLEYAAGILKTGNFYGNSKSYLCDKKYCPIFNQCQFR